MSASGTCNALTLFVVLEHCNVLKSFISNHKLSLNRKQIFLICASSLSIFTMAKLIQKELSSIRHSTTRNNTSNDYICKQESKIDYYYHQFLKTESHAICSCVQTSLYMNCMLPFILLYSSHKITELVFNLPSPAVIHSFISNIKQSNVLSFVFIHICDKCKIMHSIRNI